jgi:hypothetical protein
MLKQGARDYQFFSLVVTVGYDVHAFSRFIRQNKSGRRTSAATLGKGSQLFRQGECEAASTGPSRGA